MIEEKQINIEGIRTNYKIAGSGKTILILHGWRGSSDSWKEVLKCLSVNFRVISLDLPGFGKTSSPKKPFGIKEYVDFVLSFARTVKMDTFFLIGHSFGGGIACAISAKSPERVEGLVLCGAAVIRNCKKKLNKRQKGLSKLAKLKSIPLINNRFTRFIAYRLGGVSDYYLLNDTMRESFKKVISCDLSKCAERVRCKTLIVWGEKDEYVPRDHAFKLKEMIKNSSVEIMPLANHSPHLSRPEKLSKIIFNFFRCL